MTAVFSEHLLDEVASLEKLDAVHAFIDQRRAAAQAIIDAPPDHPAYPQPRGCVDPVGEVNATFSTRWGSNEEELFAYPGTMTGTVWGRPVENFMVGAQAEVSGDGHRQLLIVGVDESFETATGLLLHLVDGLDVGTYPIDVAALNGYLFDVDLTSATPEPENTVVLGGDLMLGEISYAADGVISGEIDALLLPNFL